MKFKKGDKVKLPIGKSTICGRYWDKCSARQGLRDGQDFLYVRGGYDYDEEVVVSPQDFPYTCGGYDYDGEVVVSPTEGENKYLSVFKEEDLELYEPKVYVGLTFTYGGMDIVYTISDIKDDLVFITSSVASTFTSMYKYKTFIQYFKDGVFTLVDQNKKIVGYKAPTDLFGGLIKKGTIYKKYNSEIYHVRENANCIVPKEIAETWEAVYEVEDKKEVVLLGDKKTPVKIHKDFLQADNTYFAIKTIKELVKGLTSYVIGKYDVNVLSLKIGCTTFTLDEVKNIINIHDKLNK